MILDELVLHNFGVYRGRQTVRLTPPEEGRPVVLFGGLNGGGKTTFLDALQLALYGPFARCSNREGLSYQDYLAQCVHRGASAQQAAIELAFRHTIAGEEEEYRIHRSWTSTSSGTKERFEVLRNGQLDKNLTENWNTQVEDFIPNNIAHLFFFDGEKIERYASRQSSSELIQTAIQGLLGLDIVDQLSKDLRVLERRKKKEKQQLHQKQHIDQLESEIERLQAQAAKLRDELAHVNTYEIERKEYELRKAQTEYENLGGELYDRSQEIQAELARLDGESREKAAELRDLASGVLPLALVPEFLNRTSQRIRQENQDWRNREIIEVLEDRDSRLLEALKSANASQEALSEVSAFLEQDRERRAPADGDEPVLNFGADIAERIEHLSGQQLTEALQRARFLEAAYAQVRDRHRDMNEQYDSIPDSEALRDIRQKCDQLRSEIADARAKTGRLSKELERITGEIERRQKDIRSKLDEAAKEQVADEDRKRILDNSTRVQSTLGEFKTRVVARHVKRIEQLVLDSYKQLLRKHGLVSRIAIDPESYDLWLYDRNDAVLSSDRLSAGERQLLAVALLWGLGKASGRPLPTAIDTPLGRLDASHRRHLVERYFPNASHQVLLFSTDEEITGEYFDLLAPWLGRRYELVFDEAESATDIVEGYFNEQEAA